MIEIILQREDKPLSIVSTRMTFRGRRRKTFKHKRFIYYSSYTYSQENNSFKDIFIQDSSLSSYSLYLTYNKKFYVYFCVLL